MAHTDYISTDKWFAWYPIKIDSNWVWWTTVNRTVDDRPVQYQGLLSIVTYEHIK